MADIWFTSDTHFGHENIISFCDRPFSSVTEMDYCLETWWNNFVRPSDHVYHLGDVTMERGSKNGAQAKEFVKLIRRLHGHKRLILGNHDHFPVQVYLEAGFEKVMAMQMLEGIRFTHIPIHPASMGSARANVHGHIHNNQDHHFPPVKYEDGSIRPYVNISVEVTAYRPLSFEEVRQRIRDAGGKI